MHQRHQATNIPIEIVRSIVTIADLGSFSKAGKRLRLSQSAISAQVKRFQLITGEPVFERVSGGVTLTRRGEAVIAQARAVLDENDQLLLLCGSPQAVSTIRVGFPALYVRQIIAALSETSFASQIHCYCDISAEIVRSIDDGFLDVACVLNPPVQERLVDEWREECVWTRSPEFLLGHGVPIPLVEWTGSYVGQLMIDALKREGRAFRVAFASPDRAACTVATVMGKGLTALPAREVEQPLIVANDHYLPKLGSLRGGTLVRQGFNAAEYDEILSALRAFRQPETSVVGESGPDRVDAPG